jgi:ribosomal protein S6-L-glutamate ligase RimK-like protein
MKPRFFCVTHRWLDDTNAVLSAACAERGIEFVLVAPDEFVANARTAPRRGDLLYRAAAGIVGDRVEKQLWQPGVATFYETPFFECSSQPIWLARHGIPLPRTAHTLPKDRVKLDRIVRGLGGFPVVVKVPGGEGGQGVIRVDSLPALFSLLDYAPESAVMMEFFEHVVAYRLVVLGKRVIAAEARHPGAFDFRSNAGGGLIGRIRAPKRLTSIALSAAKALRLEFGGVDLLEDSRGRVRFAELNFPCYFADQQRDSGIDIAGAMVDYLLAKSRRR